MFFCETDSKLVRSLVLRKFWFREICIIMETETYGILIHWGSGLAGVTV